MVAPAFPTKAITTDSVEVREAETNARFVQGNENYVVLNCTVRGRKFTFLQNERDADKTGDSS